MVRRNPLIFVDSNVLIEALFVPGHPAAAVGALAANQQIDLVTCELVVQDIEDAITERCRIAGTFDLIDTWDTFKCKIHLRVEQNPPQDLVRRIFTEFMGVMRHAADIPVLASAIQIGPTLILSGNTEHFNDAVAERSGIPIMTCGQFFDRLSRELELT